MHHQKQGSEQEGSDAPMSSVRTVNEHTELVTGSDQSETGVGGGAASVGILRRVEEVCAGGIQTRACAASAMPAPSAQQQTQRHVACEVVW